MLQGRKVKKIYLVGIKGTGMSSLAVLLKKLGYAVTGSDTAEKFFTESQLKGNAIKFFEGFSPENIDRAQPDLAVVSTAYTDKNPEVAHIAALDIPVLSYPAMVGEISRQLKSTAVCGSHGKTTTTSMLGFIMESNGRTVTLTGTVADALNRHTAAPKFFVFEADEYQNKLQFYSPANVILTNVDYDHPDYFRDEAQYEKVFRDFASRILRQGGFVLYNRDDKTAHKTVSGLRGLSASYGFHPDSRYRITGINAGQNEFSIMEGKNVFLRIALGVYGKHNILNATAAAVMARRLGIPPATVRRRLKAFAGVKRRMERIPNKRYIAIDDYGHHPTEIRATLSALRNKYADKNIVTVFHPHTFTRTKALKKEFGAAFKDSDLTIVLDIYPSAREIAGGIHPVRSLARPPRADESQRDLGKATSNGIHSRDLVAEIKKNKSRALYISTIPAATKYIKKHVPKNSVILTIGAGDVWKMHKLLV